VQVTNAGCVLTINLECTDGFADLYTMPNKLPTPLRHKNKALTTVQNLKNVRIVTADQGVGVVGVLVLSPLVGARYRVWAYQSGDSSVLQAPMRRATAMVKAFDKLIANNTHDLNMHLTSLLHEAHSAVARDDDKAAPLTALQYAQGTDASQAARSRPYKVHDDENEAVENMLFKTGKRKIKNETRTNRLNLTDNDGGPFNFADIDSVSMTEKEREIRVLSDPNMDSDLLIPWSSKQNAGTIDREIQILCENEKNATRCDSDFDVYFPPISASRRSSCGTETSKSFQIEKKKNLSSKQMKAIVYTTKKTI
jgi:hypothetical protein